MVCNLNGTHTTCTADASFTVLFYGTNVTFVIATIPGFVAIHVRDNRPSCRNWNYRETPAALILWYCKHERLLSVRNNSYLILSYVIIIKMINDKNSIL